MLVLVRLTVPYPIFLPNDKAWSLGTSDRPVKVRVSRRMGSWYFAFDEENLTWINPPDMAGSETEEAKENDKTVWYRTVVERGKRREVARQVGVYKREDAFLIGLQDRQPYTVLVVTFETDHRCKEELDAATDDLIETAFEHTRFFVATYRLISNNHQCWDPRPSDSPLMEVLYADEYVNEPSVTEAKFRLLSQRIRPRSSIIVSLFDDDEIPADQVKAVGERLREGTEVPLYLHLLLDASERAMRDEDPRTGIVLAVSAFETFVQQRLLEEYEARGIEEVEVGGRRVPRNEAIERGALMADLLECYARELAGRSVKDDPAYHDWREEAYERRRQIVHRGRREVTKGEFEAAFDASVAYMNRLHALLISARA